MRQRKLGNMIIKDRTFKVGDVIRWVSMYAPFNEHEERGLGIIFEVDGSNTKSYWTGDKKIRKINMVLEKSSYILQDYAPIPQVTKAIELARRLERIVEEDYCERVI